MAEIASLFVRLGLKGQDFTKGLKNASSSVAKFTTNVAKMGVKVASVAAGAGALAGAFAFKKSISEFADFESALTDMGKVTSESLESIKKKIMGLDSSLGSSTELVRGYYQVISAGVKDPQRALETLVVSSKAAKAAHVEQAEVIKGLTKIMAGYEGEIKTVSDAADLLFAIEKEGQTSVQELIPVIGGLAKISHDVGVSQQEMGAALAVITQTAGSTAEAATQYQAVLMALMRPTTEMRQALKDLEYESTQAMIAELGLAGTLKKLQEYTGGSAQKMAALFGRVEGLKGMSALAAKDFETLAATTKEIGKSAGSAEEAWQKYKDTLEAIWTTFKNTLGKQLILLGESLAPILKSIIEMASAWLEKNREIIATKLTKWVQLLITGFKQLYDWFSPVVSIIMDRFIPAIQQIISSVREWYLAHEDLIKSSINDFLEMAARVIGAIIEQIKEVITWTKVWYEDNKQYLEPLAQAFVRIATNYDKVFIPAVEAAGTALELFITLVGKLIEWFVNLGKWLGETAAKITMIGEKIATFVKKWGGKTVDFVMNFMGKGSSVKPLTEKITEINGKIAGFADMVNNTKPKLMVDASPATAALESLKKQYKSVMSAMYEKYAKIGYQYELASPGFRPLSYLTGEKQAQWRRNIAQEERRWQRVFSDFSRYSGVSQERVNVNISPTFMTGDHRSLNEASQLIYEKIVEMQRRGTATWAIQ